MGRPKAELTLSDEERAALEGWVRGRSTPQAWALRCRIILACAEDASNKDVAAQLGSTPHAVGRWRARFVQYRIAGLGDMPRSGGPRTVSCTPFRGVPDTRVTILAKEIHQHHGSTA
ncbi:helix-turn-helix domain-containing protein [Streptomyces mirabilis]|uniref:helix-turn-helix domain-containing protein n=1 Tax=Streptomyces mirabilis TaxID=68239 RepID=UPI0036E7069C